MYRNPPMINLLNQSQAQNWNASRLALMQMVVVGVGVNPPKKNPDNRQIPKPREQNSVDWRLSGLIKKQEVPVKPVTAVAINKMIGPSTSPNPVPTTVAGMRALVNESKTERYNSR